MRLLLSALFLDVGLVLLVLPWSSYWDRNYFAALLPAAQIILTNNFIRGAVSGLGVINLAACAAELVAHFKARPVPGQSLSMTVPAAADE
jgi:hypothetical protein